MSRGMADRLRLADDDPRRARAIALDNPMSEDDALMRTALLGSLIDALARNVRRGNADLALFESSTVHLAAAEPRVRPATPADEHHHLALVLTGAARAATWREPRPPVADMFAAKGRLAAVLDALRTPWTVTPGEEPFLHPGRSARVWWRATTSAGSASCIRSSRRRGTWTRSSPVSSSTSRPSSPPRRRPRSYEDVVSFPAVRQDLAVVVPEAAAAADVLATVRVAGSELLDEADVFDVYRGEQVGEGRYSLALHLEFRAPDRTLTDEEVAGLSRGSSPPFQRSSAVSCVASVAVLGASRLRRRARRRALARHPFFDLAALTARSDAGCASTRSIRATACRSSSRRSTSTPRRGRRRDRRLPARRAAPAVAALASATSRSST